MVIGGVLIVAATIGVIYCRGHKKGMHKDMHKHPMCIICRHIWKLNYTLALYCGLVKVHLLTKENPPLLAHFSV